MKVVAGLLVLAAAIAMAQGKVKIEPVYKEGASYKHKTMMTVTMDQIEATVAATLNTKVKSSTADKIETESNYEGLEIKIGDEPIDVNLVPMVVTQTPAGELKSITGGLEDADTVRTFLLLYFPMPTKELAKDETWTSEIKKNDAGIPNLKIDGTYLGTEDALGKKAHKFKVKIAELGGEPFSTEGTYWVQTDGKVVQIESKYKGLPIRQAGASADGTFSAKLVD